MTTAALSSVRAFLRDDSGTATVEFVLLVPVYLSMLIFAIELSFITLRHTMIERGLDIAVREVRLGTGTAPQHDQIKRMVCDNAILVQSCETNLRLEMRPADIRAYDSLDSTIDCTEAAAPSKPVRQFTPGQQNQLMLLRACLKYDPMFPDRALGDALDTDVSGQAVIVSTTAFVQEPI
jgi:hypothetical protein